MLGTLPGPAVQNQVRFAPAVGQNLNVAPDYIPDSGPQRFRYGFLPREARGQLRSAPPAVRKLTVGPHSVQDTVTPPADGGFDPVYFDQVDSAFDVGRVVR